MEFLEGKILTKHLLDSYSRNPKGWSFTMYPSSSKAQDGFLGATVSGPDEVWQLKLDSIFKPNPLMLGTKVDVDPLSIKPQGPVSYGYRKIDSQLIGNLLRALAEKKGEDTVDRVFSPIAPVVPKGGEPYAEGPFIFTGRENAGIGESQKVLEDRLSQELRSLLRKRYQSYG